MLKKPLNSNYIYLVCISLVKKVKKSLSREIKKNYIRPGTQKYGIIHHELYSTLYLDRGSESLRRAKQAKHIYKLRTSNDRIN